MPYTIRYSNPNKLIVVQDNAINSETSISFVGKEYTNYAPVIAESLLHLLENFANATQPSNPLPGQLWFNTSTNSLSVFNNLLNWKDIGVITTSGTTPSRSLAGELWVDTINSQLKLYTGTAWVAVGPTPSGSIKSGAYVETIVDTASVPHIVILFYSQDSIIAILSGDPAFEPNESRAGFPSISPGINLSTTINNIKLYGTATSADSLSVNNGTVIIPADRVVRYDILNTLLESLQIQSNNGVLIGNNLSFGLQLINGIPTIISGLLSLDGGNNVSADIDIDLYPQTGDKRTVVKITADGRVKIGVDFVEDRPTDTLHVKGNVYIDGDIASSGNITSYFPTSEGLEVDVERNSEGYSLGYRISTGCLLEGVWVGSSDSVSAPVSVNDYNSMFTAISSYSIMQITNNGQYDLVEFKTTSDGNGMEEILQTGHINKLRDQCYFRVRDDTNGLWFTPVNTNQSYDSLNMFFIGPPATTTTPVSNRSWKTHTYYRVSRTTDNYETIKTELLTIARQWSPLP